ncbi:MAG: hypothetical protein ACFFD8_08125 [Candidatus Thorarchaeota archaeon]
MSSPKSLIFVIDTSAIFNRIQYTAEDIPLATTPLIENEMQQKGLKDTIDLLVATQKLRIITPSTASLAKIQKVASQLGDLPYLSEPDQQLLALALDLLAQNFSPILITDDYSIQNVAHRLSLEHKGTNQPGIREVLTWETYCSACGHKAPDLIKEKACPICGTALTRRAIRKERI